MEEVYFSSQEIDTLFMTKPVVGNYALVYAMGWCNSRYNQTDVSYKEDFQEVKNYITPAKIKNPRYSLFKFNALSDSYHHMMQKAQYNYPQIGKIKALSIGNRAEGLIFCNEDIRKVKYIRLGKFMGKCKVSYEECPYEIIEDERGCYGLINSADLHSGFEIKGFNMINVYPVPLFNKLTGKGKMYKISTKDGILYYPCNVSLGG